MNKLLSHLDISDEIVEAIDKDKPVIALETAILTHGLPYPQSLKTALECEALIRANGCIPATLAVIDGRIKVGLTEDELERMCLDPSVVQMSRKDLPIVIANGLNGSTTVATSILIARMVGIRVLVTAGIGGVHRGATKTFDISRDLQEVASNNICVVCSGPKSILDLELTLEYLETYGVPVLGYGVENMPSYYTRDSGVKIDYKFDDPDEIGKTIKTKWDIGLVGGAIVANPIPEEYALDEALVEETVKEALEKAKGIPKYCKDPTPLFLELLSKKTQGLSLVSQMELIKYNARVGSMIAKEIYRID